MIASLTVELRIVRSWPAQATGESYYETEDGRVWRTAWTTPTLTGVTYGSLAGGHIVVPRRASATVYRPRVVFFDRPRPQPTLDEVSLPCPPPEVPRSARVPAAFVGGGLMHRRWR